MSNTTERRGGTGRLTPPGRRRFPTPRRNRGEPPGWLPHAHAPERPPIDYEQEHREWRRPRMDPWRRNEIEVLVSIVVVIVASGIGAYFYGLWMYGPV